MKLLKKTVIALLFLVLISTGIFVLADIISAMTSVNVNHSIFIDNTFRNRFILLIVLFAIIFIYRKKLLSYIIKSNDTSTTNKDFRHVLLSIQDAVISTDKFGKVKRINKSAEDMIGYKYNELKEKNIATILNLFTHKQEKDILYNPIVELFVSKKDKINYEHLILKNRYDRTYFVSVNASVVKNESNEVEGAVIILRDVTEKSTILQELNNNRNEINLLLSNMKEGIIIVNNDGVITQWSKGTEQILELKKEDVINQFSWDIIPNLIISRDYEFDKLTYKKTVLDTLADNSKEMMNKNLSQQIKTPDGKIKNIESYNLTYKVNNQNFIATIFRDITEEKQFQGNILKSEEKFNKIFDLSPIAIMIADLYSGEIIDLNQSFESLLNWEKSQILNKTTLEINFWINKKEKIAYLKQLLRKGEVKNFIVNIKTRKGNTLICSLSGSTIIMNDRKVVINYIEDITEIVSEELKLQRITTELEDKVKTRTIELELINDNLQEQIFERINTENALRESEEKFRSLISQLPVGIYRTSLNGAILETNPALAHILGFNSVDELKDKRIYEFFENFEKRNETYFKQKFAGEILKEESKFIKSDGTIIWVFNNAKIIKDSLGNIIIDGTIEDITYRKSAQAALLESKEKYRKLFDNLSEIYLSINNNGILMEVSPSFEKISGFQIKDFLGKNIDSILSTDDVNDYFIHAYKNIKEPANFIISIKNNQNKICFLSLNLKPNIIASVIHGFEGIARDITGEIEHNNITDTLYAISRAVNLTESLDELFRYIHKALNNIVDTTNFFFALVDYDNNLIQFPYLIDEVDEPIEAIPLDTPDSYTAKVIMSGKPILRRFDDIDQLQNKKDDITGTYSLVWLGVPLIAKDKVIGAMVVQSYKDYFLYNESDIDLLQSVSDQVALAIDRKRSQIQLDNQFKFVQNLLEAIPNPVYYKDIKTKQFLLCNRAYAEHLGYTEEYIIGKTISELITDNEYSVYDKYDDEIINQIGIQSYETVLKKNDGSIVNSIVFRSLFIDSQGVAVGIVGAINDMTATKKAEAEIIKSLKKEQELGELKSNFISMVSHEYRTPLQAMLMSTELLHDYWDKLNIDSREKQFERIKNSIITLNSMLDDVILLNKSERGALVCKRSLVNLTPICESLTREIQFLAKDRCTVDLIIENPDTNVYIDEKLTHLVLINLLSNSVKYSKSGGNVYFKVSSDNSYVNFIIQDNGIGIPEIEQKRLFEPFFRSRNVGTISGTGLGLAIVNDAIKAQEGSIRFDSIEHIGTTFYVTIPNIKD